jgi:hypothetical protein
MTPAASSPVTIHPAWRASDGTGAVYYGPEITRDQAIARRRQGENVVVRGEGGYGPALEAQTIEAAVGRCIPHPAHIETAGPLSLPHFQQQSGSPAEHTYYETPIRKAIPAS